MSKRSIDEISQNAPKDGLAKFEPAPYGVKMYDVFRSYTKHAPSMHPRVHHKIFIRMVAQPCSGRSIHVDGTLNTSMRFTVSDTVENENSLGKFHIGVMDSADVEHSIKLLWESLPVPGKQTQDGHVINLGIPLYTDEDWVDDAIMLLHQVGYLKLGHDASFPVPCLADRKQEETEHEPEAEDDPESEDDPEAQDEPLVWDYDDGSE